MKRAGFLDLPATALALIASYLGISDKENLALTCKAMPSIIRPLWISLQVDLASEEPPPAALINFSGITTIVVVDSRMPLPVLATSTEPAFHNETYQDPGIMVLYTLESLGRVCSVISTILTAAANLETGEQRKLSLRVAVPGNKTGAMLKLFIQNISPKQHHDMSGVALAGMYMLLAASSLLPGGNVAAASSAANSSANGSQAAVLRGYLNKLLARPSFQQLLSSNATMDERPEIMFSKATSALDHIHHLSNGGGSPYYPFTSVDAGWFIPDGCLADVITKGMVAWCESTAADQFRLEMYTQLHTLRLCVYRADEFYDYEEVSNDFNARVVPQINALPVLRELHLCGTSEDPYLHNFSFSNFLLPRLTRLVVGRGYLSHSFLDFTHLHKLQQLAVSLDEEDWERGYELNDLAHLRSLDSLEVSHLALVNWQNTERLTALTSLKLLELQEYNIGEQQEDGYLRSFILPRKPMPKLRELDLIFGKDFFTKDRKNAQKSDATIEWVLQNAAVTFPGVETMRLGVLKFPALLDIEVFTVHVAAHLMDNRVHELLGNAPNLKYLTVEQARVQEEQGALDAAIESGEFGNILEKEMTIKTGGSQSVEWQREAKFSIYVYNHYHFVERKTRRAVRAHFEYTRK